MVFDIPTIIMMVVTSLVVILLVAGLTRTLTAGVPGGSQNVMEWVVDFVSGITHNFMEPKKAAQFVTLGLTLFLYIFLGNQLGLVFNVNTAHTQVSESFMDMLTVSGSHEQAETKQHHIEEQPEPPS